MRHKSRVSAARYRVAGPCSARPLRRDSLTDDIGRGGVWVKA